MKISYAITVCNEVIEFARLVGFLLQNKRPQDEIVVLIDSTEDNAEMMKTVNQFMNGQASVYSHELNNDFAAHKNYLNSKCTGDYIFQLDADEMITEYMLHTLPLILENNRVDMIRVPRINTVEGLTEEHIKKWGWRVDEKGRVNFPDFQTRIYRNDASISWQGKVHEKITGCKFVSYLPLNDEYCLIHHKTIDKQERQNDFYETI